LLVKGKLFIVSGIFSNEELILASFVGMDIFTFRYFEVFLFLLVVVKLLLFLELLTPTPKSYPVVTFISFKNLANDLHILLT